MSARFEHCPTCSNFRLWFSAVHLNDSLSRDFFVVRFESELLPTWSWHQSSAGSASSLTSEERSSVLLNNRWPTLEVKKNPISPPQGLVGYRGIILVMQVVLSFSVLHGESHARFNADAYRLIVSVKAPGETTGPPSVSPIVICSFWSVATTSQRSFANQIAWCVCAPVTWFVIG